MHRKSGALDALRLEEGGVSAPSSSNAQADEDLWKRRQVTTALQQRQGWNPTTVLLCGALLLSLCFSTYLYNEAAEKKLALAGLASSLQSKSTEFAQSMATTKRQLEETQTGKRKVEELERQHEKELEKLHEELTNVKHSLHEEQVKSMRLHRDNNELHKKLRTKSSELKVLEDQARLFEKEMNQLTKTIHTLQGEAHDVASTTDYQILYKRQEEQQQRYRDKQEQATTSGGSKPTSSKDSSSSSSSGHGKSGGRHGKHGDSKQQAKSGAAADAATAAGGDGEGTDADDLLDDGHEYRDHDTVSQ